jgi:ABC-type transporter Mla subunit MlaD
VVTYVANADNYRQKYDDLRVDADSLQERAASLKEQLNEKITEKQRLEDKLNSQIASLQGHIEDLQIKLDNAERDKAELLRRVDSWTGMVQDFQETNEKQGQLLQDTLNELKQVQGEQIKQSQRLNETTATLVEKMAVIEDLETKMKRLQQEKVELQNRLDELLLPIGEVVPAPKPVTPEKDKAQPIAPGLRAVPLQGKVTGVDLKNSIASVSVGSADGVKEGMKFYATRGDKFICEILIIDVWPEEAVGVLERVQYQPKVGDNVSTSL